MKQKNQEEKENEKAFVDLYLSHWSLQNALIRFIYSFYFPSSLPIAIVIKNECKRKWAKHLLLPTDGWHTANFELFLWFFVLFCFWFLFLFFAHLNRNKQNREEKKTTQIIPKYSTNLNEFNDFRAVIQVKNNNELQMHVLAQLEFTTK